MKFCNGFSSAAAIALLGATHALASGANDHSHNANESTEMLKSMQEMHEDHEHGHDFAAMDDISEEDMCNPVELAGDFMASS